MVSGNIELTEVNIAFKTAGRLIERTVDEGDAVKKGQVIARLDRDQLVAQRAAQVAAHPIGRIATGAGGDLARVAEGQRWRRTSRHASADLASNEARLAELRNGSRPQEKLDAKAAVDAAQSEVERAETIGSARRRYIRMTISPRRSTTNTATAGKAPTAALNSAKEREALVLAGPRIEQVNAAQGTGGAGAGRAQNGRGERAGNQAAGAGNRPRGGPISNAPGRRWR